MELFHKLIQKNRKKGLEHIQDINVNGKTYSGSDEVILGFQEHFRSLSTFDKSAHKEIRYHQQLEMENKYITEMSKEELILLVTEEELTTAVASINKRKSADFHSLTIEHIVHAGENIITVLTHILNSIFLEEEVLKIRLLSPIFKNKGSKNESINYRGISVLPVISRIVEAVIRVRIQPLIHNMQNPTQRGFTKGSSPINAALPVEEAYRILTDEKQNGHLVLLDAKAAFDKVKHSHLFRRMYHAGIQDKTWTIIKSLHHNAGGCIKWAGSTSDCFKIGMGGRQRGILSTDLYKRYINPLLDRLQDVGIGLKIGSINVNNTGCADDIALLSTQLSHAQIMVNMALDFANLEGYELQPKKGVAIHTRGNNEQCEATNEKLNMGNITMPEVEQATHLGIIRTTTMKPNIQTNVDENITKARRSAYSLFGCGFHGHNGLDPESLLHIYKTYITPVLLYGRELLLPSSKLLEQLELFQKRILKQILSLPMSCAEPAVYILTGILPNRSTNSYKSPHILQ